MNDLIKRSDAIKVVDSYIGTDPIVEKLKDIPSVEPKKVCIGQIHFDDEKLHEIVNEAVEKLKEEIEPKQGEWERIPYSMADYGRRCSLCHFKVGNPTNFCPDCGSRMFPTQMSGR